MSDLDPDARFLLANERTLLAWVRTGLTLLAVGVGVVEFGGDLAGQSTLAVSLVLLGVAASLTGAVRYARADRALRQGLLPATGASPYVVSGAVVVLGLALAVAVIGGR